MTSRNAVQLWCIVHFLSTWHATFPTRDSTFAQLVSANRSRQFASTTFKVSQCLVWWWPSCLRRGSNKLTYRFRNIAVIGHFAWKLVSQFFEMLNCYFNNHHHLLHLFFLFRLTMIDKFLSILRETSSSDSQSTLIITYQTERNVRLDHIIEVWWSLKSYIRQWYYIYAKAILNHENHPKISGLVFVPMVSASLIKTIQKHRPQCCCIYMSQPSTCSLSAVKKHYYPHISSV